MKETSFAVSIRRAVPDDADAVLRVLSTIAAERVYSAIDAPWSLDEERRFLASLAPREVVHVALDATQDVVGLQILDRWSPFLRSMAHVGQVGTFLLPAWRGQGIGGRLWGATLPFAREAGYRKLVIQVRASNALAQKFYTSLGFVECGRLRDQVLIDGQYDDEVMFERAVTPA